MASKLKIGTALLSVLALSAIAATAASAEYNLTPASSPAVLTAEQIPHVVGGEERNYFEITSTGTRVECTSSKYTGTISGTNVTSATVHPTYTGCTAAGFAATIDTTGCDFILTGETTLDGLHGKTHVECEAGKAIEITIPSISCTIKVHAQTPTGGGLSYTNTAGPPADIYATATVTGVTYERVGNGFFCALAAPSEGNDSDLVSKITVKAYGDPDTGSNQIGLTVSTGVPAEHYLTPASSPAVLTAEQIPHVVGGEERNYYEFTATGMHTECNSWKYTGTIEGVNVASAPIRPTANGCFAVGWQNIWDTTGCNFVLTTETNAQGSGKIHLECEAGKAIEITIPAISCTIKIHAQTPTGGGWTYSNTAGTIDDIHATLMLTGITYERIGNGFPCSSIFPSEGNDLDLFSKVTLKAYGDPDTGTNQINLTVS